MAIARHPVIAQEGWRFIFLTVLLAATINYSLGEPGIIAWILPVFIVWLYRDPHKKLVSQPLGLVSPVNGKVILVENHPDPFLGRDALLFRIEMSAMDLYSIRSVTEGKIIQQWLDPEETSDDKSLAHAIQIQTDEGDDIMVVLRPGRFTNQLSCNALIGERIGQGIRCGIIPFGSVVDVYVPADCIVKANSGDYVEAGSSLLASLKPHV